MQTWTRREWCDEAAAALDELIRTDRELVLERIGLGAALLFEITGPDYGGWIILRFFDDADGAVVCDCVAFSGWNTAAGLSDLMRVAKKAGAQKLICTTEQAGVVRLYQRQGWRVSEYTLEHDL